MYTGYWKCPDCDLSLPAGDRAAHACDAGVRERVQVARAEKELDNGNVAALLAMWGTDATAGLPAENQDANVTITARRAWAEWLRKEEDGCSQTS